jgi:muramoyltetrapeptide carboxypeptidase
LNGLIVGSFTQIQDNDIPFGQTVEEIVMEHVKDYHYPVCFDFPAGHIPNNQALIFGRQVQLTVAKQGVSLAYSL